MQNFSINIDFLLHYLNTLFFSPNIGFVSNLYFQILLYPNFHFSKFHRYSTFIFVFHIYIFIIFNLIFSLFLFIFFLSLPLQPTATPPSLFFLLFSFSNQLHHRLPPTPNVKQIFSYRRITVSPSHSSSVTPCMFRSELFGYLLHRSVSVRIWFSTIWVSYGIYI